jgi:hypothetical protein
VSLAAGRPFTLEEEMPGSRIPVVIVGYDRWRNSGFSPTLLGSQLRLNGTDFTIVAVAPPGFAVELVAVVIVGTLSSRLPTVTNSSQPM